MRLFDFSLVLHLEVQLQAGAQQPSFGAGRVMCISLNAEAGPAFSTWVCSGSVITVVNLLIAVVLSFGISGALRSMQDLPSSECSAELLVGLVVLHSGTAGSFAAGAGTQLQTD